MDDDFASDLENFHFKFKLSIVGDTGVGKSSFIEGNFLLNPSPLLKPWKSS